MCFKIQKELSKTFENLTFWNPKSRYPDIQQSILEGHCQTQYVRAASALHAFKVVLRYLKNQIIQIPKYSRCQIIPAIQIFWISKYSRFQIFQISKYSRYPYIQIFRISNYSRCSNIPDIQIFQIYPIIPDIPVFQIS